MRISPLRAAALGCPALGFLLLAAPASADTVTTRTGQKLSVDVAGEIVAGRAVAQGTATITAGPTTIASVQVSFDNHENITVGVDDRGRFEVDSPWPGATSVTVRATATASDGTTATSVAEGRIAKPAPAKVHHRQLADTGAPGPRILGPLGLLLVLAGLRLITWSRQVEPEDLA